MQKPNPVTLDFAYSLSRVEFLILHPVSNALNFGEYTKMKQDLLKGVKSTVRNAVIFLLCTGILGFFAYWKLGDFGQSVFVEAMFDEIRYGPYGTMSEIDNKLAWLNRSEISKENIRPSQLIGPDLDLIRESKNLTFVSYYLGEYGFIVVFDQEGRKLTWLSSDV